MNHQWLMTHCSVSSPEEASEVAPPIRSPARASRQRISTWAKARRLSPGDNASTTREIERDRDPGGNSGDEHRRGWLPAPPVGGADSKPERACNRCLNNNPDSSNEERDRAGSEHRDQRRPRSLPGRKRGEGDDCQALKGGPNKGHEPPKYLEHERQITQNGGLCELGGS